MSAKDFDNRCERTISKIAAKLKTEPYQLPANIDDLEYLQLDELDELMRDYFTFKFLAREYDFEISDEMYKKENFIVGLLKLIF